MPVGVSSLELAATWRALMLRRGLLRLSESTSSPCPARQGVSLAYLEAWVATLAELRQKFVVPDSTSDVWRQLVMPALAQMSGKSRWVRRHGRVGQWSLGPGWVPSPWEMGGLGTWTLKHPFADVAC